MTLSIRGTMAPLMDYRAGFWEPALNVVVGGVEIVYLLNSLR